MSGIVRFFHILSAAVWVGGLITLGVLVGALRRSGVQREDLRTMANSFRGLWWMATFVAVATGLIGLWQSGGLPSDDTGYPQRLFVKLALIGVAVALAVGHTMTARTASAATRGLIQSANLIVGIAVIAAAVWL